MNEPATARIRHLQRLSRRMLNVAFLGIGACGPEITVTHVVPSPDSAFVARYYQLYWPPPGTHSAERVSVLPRGASFHPRTADFIFEMSGGGDLTLMWTGPRRLVIAHPGWADVRRRCATAHGVSFSYDARPTLDSSWSKLARVYYTSHRQLDEFEISQGKPPVPPVDNGLTAHCG